MILLSLLAGFAGDEFAEVFEICAGEVGGFKQVEGDGGGGAVEGAINEILQHAAERGALF